MGQRDGVQQFVPPFALIDCRLAQGRIKGKIGDPGHALALDIAPLLASGAGAGAFAGRTALLAVALAFEAASAKELVGLELLATALGRARLLVHRSAPGTAKGRHLAAAPGLVIAALTLFGLRTYLSLFF